MYKFRYGPDLAQIKSQIKNCIAVIRMLTKKYFNTGKKPGNFCTVLIDLETHLPLSNFQLEQVDTTCSVRLTTLVL